MFLILIIVAITVISIITVWLYKKRFQKRQMSIRANLERILYNIDLAFTRFNRKRTEIATNKPRLVAVSKTKPIESILEAYSSGQRHFGENYVQELFEKSTHPTILQSCTDINWHFIGHLQRKNAKLLSRVPNLWICESVDTQRIAETLNYQWEKNNLPLLRIMVQVNTSREEAKFGCDPETCDELVDYVIKKCPRLKFTGLMTIGKFGYNVDTMGVNPDFIELTKCKHSLCRVLSLGSADIELSMGMSTDYQHAIELGSNNVRIGTEIFGARDYTKKDS